MVMKFRKTVQILYLGKFCVQHSLFAIETIRKNRSKKPAD